MIQSETIAGTAAGAGGTIIGFPLDSIKTRMQTSSSSKFRTVSSSVSTIWSKEGILGFYRGVLSPLCALTLLNSINFTVYAYFRDKIPSQIPYKIIDNIQSSHIIIPAIAGMCGGPFASIISTPFEFLKTNMQVNSKELGNSTPIATYRIVKTYGPLIVFRGHLVNTLRECVFLGTYFGMYENLKSAFSSSFSDTMAIPLSGGLSGGIGWFVSFPLDSIKGRIQSYNLKLQPPSSIQTLKNIVRERGLTGMYRGLGPSLARAFIVSSTRFTIYETALSYARNSQHFT